MQKERELAKNTTLKKGKKRTDHEQVVEFIDQSDHPLKQVMEEVRDVILSANPEIMEHIKWNAPSFCFNGDDRVTLNLHNRAYILLVFHRGAKVKDTPGSPLFEETTGLLEWVTQDRATIKFYSMQDLDAKKDLLAKAVSQWITKA